MNDMSGGVIFQITTTTNIQPRNFIVNPWEDQTFVNSRRHQDLGERPKTKS